MHHLHYIYDTCSNADAAIALMLLDTHQWAKISQGSTLTAIEKRYFQHQHFNARLGDICLIYNPEGNIIKAYLGLAEGDEQAVITALAMASSRLPPGSYLPSTPIPTNAKIAWGTAKYQFTDYKQKLNVQQGKHDSSSAKLCIEASELPALVNDLHAIFRVRDLINMPANDLDPAALAKCLQEIALAHNAHYKEIVGEHLLTANFPAIHAVGRASIHPPRLLSLAWGKKEHPSVTLVGKGVCFDTGGLDLKPSSGMRFMKKDMGGAAHVIALAEWIMATQLPIYLRVLIPAVENAIGHSAYRPGDILTMRNGLTVEVDNTDAEGRLVLADAITHACEDSPALLIDFATLTGAARVAVGTELSAMFCNHDALASAVMASSESVNDPVWRLPLFKNYRRLLNSSIADLSNCSNAPYGGAITAALFLERFVEASIPWMHFDIMAWNLTTQPGKPEGGEAMGLRAVADYLKKTYG